MKNLIEFFLYKKGKVMSLHKKCKPIFKIKYKLCISRRSFKIDNIIWQMKNHKKLYVLLQKTLLREHVF